MQQAFPILSQKLFYVCDNLAFLNKIDNKSTISGSLITYLEQCNKTAAKREFSFFSLIPI